jgi:hypothetical protein
VGFTVASMTLRRYSNRILLLPIGQICERACQPWGAACPSWFGHCSYPGNRWAEGFTDRSVEAHSRLDDSMAQAASGFELILLTLYLIPQSILFLNSTQLARKGRHAACSSDAALLFISFSNSCASPSGSIESAFSSMILETWLSFAAASAFPSKKS